MTDTGETPPTPEGVDSGRIPFVPCQGPCWHCGAGTDEPCRTADCPCSDESGGYA